MIKGLTGFFAGTISAYLASIRVFFSVLETKNLPQVPP
jgi:hypothetical protein